MKDDLGIVKHTMDPRLFASTNGPWNRLGLNSPWSVGYVSTLIHAKHFETFKDWMDFYYSTGEQRKKNLEKLSPILKEKLNDVSDNPDNRIEDPVTKEHNYYYGRTKEEMDEKGKMLHEFMCQNQDIDLETCVKAAHFRVLGETWNGIIIRENNCIKLLQKSHPKLEFKKLTGDDDYKYAVDFEVYRDEELVCGIQIKPKSYTFSHEYIKMAKKANSLKQKVYFEKTAKKVITLIAKHNGAIENKEALAAFTS